MMTQRTRNEPWPTFSCQSLADSCLHLAFDFCLMDEVSVDPQKFLCHLVRLYFKRPFCIFCVLYVLKCTNLLPHDSLFCRHAKLEESL